MDAPTIRLAHATEAAAVHAVVDAAYRHYIPRIGKPPGPMNDDYAARIAAGQAWVLDAHGTILGVLVLEHGPDGFLLDNIAILPDQQGKGLGRLLIAYAEAEARRLGFREVRLYTHVRMTENIALYRRLGFVETGHVTEKGFERVTMAKPLA